MTKEIHNQKVKELQDLEKDLIDLIADKNDEVLMDKFLEWQSKRIECNESYLEFLKVTLVL